MRTAIKQPMPDRVKPSFVGLIFDSDAQGWASECPDVKNCKWRFNTVRHRVLYSCTYMATVGVKGSKLVKGGRSVSLKSANWSVMTVSHDVGLSCCIQWRASNHQARPPAARPARSAGIRAVPACRTERSGRRIYTCIPNSNHQTKTIQRTCI